MKFKNFYTIFSVLCCALMVPSMVQANTLDDFYEPMVQDSDVFLDLEYTHFTMEEEGDHGSASFGAFFAEPSFESVKTHLRFKPLKGLEMGLGYKGHLSSKYDRKTLNQANTSVTFVNAYDLDYINHYYGEMKYRFNESHEMFIDGYNNYQRANWQSAPGLVAFDFLTDVDSHYENIKIGYRYIEKKDDQKSKHPMAYLSSALLDEAQLTVEGAVAYKAAKMERQNRYLATSPDTLREYKNDLAPHVLPQLEVSYGVTDNFTVTSGFHFAPTIRYTYDFKQFNFNNTSNFIQANYKINNQFKVPLKFAYRPHDDWQVELSIDTTYANQTLEYHEKETDNSFTQYTGKDLDYLNVNPILEVTYFIDRGKPLIEDKFSKYQKPFLAKGQTVLRFKFEKDITTLDKSDTNGAQNFIEYDSLFLYPVDSFISGTEYATFLIGNTSSLSTNVRPQNYYELEGTLEYGWTDYLNTFLSIGYNSGSNYHHFSVNDLASRFHKVEEYFYYNIGGQLRIGESGRLNVHTHYVPTYKTFVTTDINPEEFEGDTAYLQAIISYQHIF